MARAGLQRPTDRVQDLTVRSGYRVTRGGGQETVGFVWKRGRIWFAMRVGDATLRPRDGAEGREEAISTLLPDGE